MIFKEHIKDIGYRPVFSGGELRDLGIQPKSTGKGLLYTWNANGSLRAVTNLEGTTYRFRYDAFGRRIEKRRMASTFRFVWDGNVLLHETFKKDNSKNTELTTWVFEGFVPTAKLVNGKAYSIISDHLGTPILAIDSDGMEVWNRQLDIYGRVRKEYKHSSLGEDVFPFVPFLYQGQYYDFETNLAYNRFRYYSPETGAYISQDPIGLWGGINLYSYVQDTNKRIDIFGLTSTDDTNNDKGYDIYIIKNKENQVVYVGQTNDYERRKGEHIESGRLKIEGDNKMTIEKIEHVKTYGDARGYEQYYMDKYNTVHNEYIGNYDEKGKIPLGEEYNRVNSYDKNRDDERAVEFKKGYEKARKNDPDNKSCKNK